VWINRSKGDKVSYTNIALCPNCGDITEERCCDKDLILYESQHETFIDSIVPLYKEMNTCLDQ
jgi:hypothetical protein